MKTLIYVCFAFGIFNVCASETNKPNKITTTKQIADDTIQAAAAADIAKDVTNDATKDKRQTKDTKDAATANVYANHRSDTAGSGNRNSNANSDDPEDPQETIYGTNARQFLIRPQHQQQQNEEEQQQQHLVHEHQPAQQLRNYAATIRPHSTQLLEQSQEIQHFAYLQDLNRNQPKVQTHGKSQSGQRKKSPTVSVRIQSEQQQATSQVEEAEQRYSVAVEQPIPQNRPRAHIYRPQIPYHVALQQQQQLEQQQQQEREQQNSQQAQQQAQQQQQQQYQIIPEEQFLKILQEELHARQVYHDDQVRRQQSDQQQNQQHRQQQQQQQQQQQNIQHQQQQQQQHIQQQQSAAVAASQKVALQSQGLGNYRQRIETEDEREREREQSEYVQYVQRSRGGPKYLPLPQGIQEQEQPQRTAEIDPSQQPPLPHIPPQIAYYQPQISYKTLPNHPLAKSSLEKEIEKLLAINTPDVSPVQIVDNSNEPSALVNHHHHAPPAPQSSPRSHLSPKAYIPSTAAPKRVHENNNQPFLPSLFQYSGFPQPTQNYPTQVPQQVIDAKKLGPVVYPQQSATPSVETPVQASQFYYQEATPSPRPKAYRPKYGTKFATTPTPAKSHHNDINYPVHSKYAQPVLYEFERAAPTAGPAPTHFYPSPPDPHRNIPPTAPPTPAVTTKYSPTPTDFRQFALPGPSPSQSSIYVSQGTGIATPSRAISTVKPKTVDDLKQLHLPQPGGKPLTQTEFQALVDAGYPVTAVPVPVPIPYEQYVKDHPDYRNHPPPQAPALPVNYEHLMRFAQLQQHHQQVPQYGPHRGQQLQHARSLVQRPSEPSVKIISSASEPQTATAIGGGSITYLRAIPENQKRRPRDETETKVLGAKEEEKEKVKPVEDKNEK